MLIQIESFGGVAVFWPSLQLTMLIDPTAHEVWIVLRGRPVWRHAIAQC